jgi:hypothetical protein
MKFTIIFIITFPVFACVNFIPESEAIKAIALEPNAGSKTCADLPQERCLCFEGIDWKEVDLIDGELIPNPDKKFARELKEKNESDALQLKLEARKLARERLKALNPDGARTIADLKAMVRDLIEAVKE